MTLLVNEIHIRGHFHNSLILLAADRRISIQGKFHSNRKKLFKIPYLNAGVGYFGLAKLRQKEFFSSWLPNFIRHASDVGTIEGFAIHLCEELNQVVNKDFLHNSPSGFQICGYNDNGYPELWYVRNILRVEGHVYKVFEKRYSISEDFLARDARKYGFNGVDPELPDNFNQYYVNGDIRAFYSIWLRLDEFLADIFLHVDFKKPREPGEFELIAKWKMGVISSFYKKFAKKEIIGTPIDAFVLLPQVSAG